MLPAAVNIEALAEYLGERRAQGNLYLVRPPLPAVAAAAGASCFCSSFVLLCREEGLPPPAAW
jgi:hypothetical protein